MKQGGDRAVVDAQQGAGEAHGGRGDELGRRRGYGVLRVLCRISLEPDTCVKRTTGAFRKHGPGTLIAAKFIPGFGAVASTAAAQAG